MESNLLGHDSHGVVRVAPYLRSIRERLTAPGAEMRTERESESTALIDGGWNFGQVVARHTMDVAIEKARGGGTGVAVAHRSTHIGRLGAYAEQAVAAGMIGIAMANNHGAGQQVAPFGGIERRLSTNPMAFGFPTADPAAPFVLDMATAAVAEGRVRVARNRGERMPGGWLLDAEGRPTDDPESVLRPAARCDPARRRRGGLQGLRPLDGGGGARRRALARRAPAAPTPRAAATGCSRWRSTRRASAGSPPSRRRSAG